MHEIETARLSHRQLETKDKDDFVRLLHSPRVLDYCFDLPSDSEIDEIFSSRLPSWRHDSRHWLCLVIIEKQSNRFVGVTGMLKRDEVAELGFMFLPEYTGKGYATESLRALIDYSHKLGLTELKANITEGNIASIRVVEKCGFSLLHVHKNSVAIANRVYSNFEYLRKI